MAKAAKKTKSRKKTTRKKKTSPSAAGLQQVQDLLFGAQLRAQQQFVLDFEKRILDEMEVMYVDLQKSITGVEASLRKEMITLNRRVQADRKDRREAEETHGKKMTRITKGLERRIGRVEGEGSQRVTAVKRKVDGVLKKLRTDVHAQVEEILAEMDHEMNELRDSRADRAALSGMFADMAKKLKNGK